MSDSPRRYAQSDSLFARAAAVVPGGIYGHMAPTLMVPGESPYFAAHSEGARYWDADGNEFLDFLCAYGPNLLGYGHPEVEEAAARQARDGNCFNHPTARFVELAERMTSLVDFAAWAVFGKNGADLTTWAIQVAREHTGRKKILRVAGAYHGAHAWCSPGHGGWIEEDRAHIHTFPWNDLDAFRDFVRRHPGEVAGVITTAWHHPNFTPAEMPAPGFFAGLVETCRAEGIVFILDDVRSGFRLHHGGSHRFFPGCEPDLAVYCKALANGHPISAAVGRSFLRKAAARVFLTGSYWNSAAPMAAALKCIEVAERDDVVGRIAALGARFRTGLHAAAARHGFAASLSGHDSMPNWNFADDRNSYLAQAFAREAMRRGVFLHPHHNWFLCAAHTEADIDHAVSVADASLAAMKSDAVVPAQD